jgi:hypothetical protein
VPDPVVCGALTGRADTDDAAVRIIRTRIFVTEEKMGGRMPVRFTVLGKADLLATN